MHHEHTRERDPITGQPLGEQRRIETKEFFRTSEFWVFAALALAMVVSAGVSETFHAGDVWPLLTLLGVGYILSRGVSKAGTGHPFAGRTTVRELTNRVGDRRDNDHPVDQYGQPYVQPGTIHQQPQYAPQHVAPSPGYAEAPQAPQPVQPAPTQPIPQPPPAQPGR